MSVSFATISTTRAGGTYILSYFKVTGDKIAGIEKDVLLSEKIVRVLVLTTEDRPEEMVEKDINGETSPAAVAAAAEAKAAAEAEEAEERDEEDSQDEED